MLGIRGIMEPLRLMMHGKKYFPAQISVVMYAADFPRSPVLNTQHYPLF